MKSDCPVCGKTHQAGDLRKLLAAVEACCAPNKKDRGRNKPQFLPAKQVPELPAVFELPKRISSQNKTTYSHWKIHYRDKQDWMRLVGTILSPCHGLRLEQSCWSLTRLYGGREKEMDFANLVGGAKPLIDCLTEYEVIVDDAPTYFTCRYSQERGGHSMTILTLEGLSHATDQAGGV